MRTWRWYSKLLPALLLAAFAYWVWPTAWEHYRDEGVNVRVNRFTGKAEFLRPEPGHAWVAFRRRGPPPKRVGRDFEMRLAEARAAGFTDDFILLYLHDHQSGRMRQFIDNALRGDRTPTEILDYLAGRENRKIRERLDGIYAGAED